MPMLTNALALALIVADEPRPAPAPVVITGHLTGTITGSKSDDAPARMPMPLGPRTGGDPVADEVWHLTLREAIKVGLDNSPVVRVVAKGGPGAASQPDASPAGGGDLAIAPMHYDGSTWKFRAEVMAHVRSIEQQYWALGSCQVALWARETAARIGGEILDRQRIELEAGRATKADVAEAEQQLENFRLNLVSATSDVILAEKQLRNLLGLPPADGRRIVPDTAPTEAKLEPDWQASVRVMLESQPDVAERRVLVGLAEMQLLVARNQLLPPLGLEALHELANLGEMRDEDVRRLDALIGKNAARPHIADAGPSEFRDALIGRDAALRQLAGTDPSGFRDPVFIAQQVGLSEMPMGTWFRSPLANTRMAQEGLLRQRAFLQQVVHQATHSLARFFLEVDANSRQFRTAQRLRAAAQQRLEAQRAFHEQGRITIDRLLDAVSQYANAIATEAQYKSSYNTSIAALEEAKGTLLAYDKVDVVEGPPPSHAGIQVGDSKLAPASFDAPKPPGPPAQAQPQPAAMTYKMKAKIAGVPFLDVEVEVAPTPARP